jgi:hypothetical protein
MTHVRTLGAWAVVLLAGGAQAGLQRSLDQEARAVPPSHPQVPSYPAALAQGLLRRQAAADILWVRATSYAGDDRFNAEGHHRLPALLKLVVTLDPKFEAAHYFGALLLSGERGTVPAAIDLLELAEQRFPHRWAYPFFAGANHLFELGNSKAAAEAWTRASRIPGAPTYLASVAARALASKSSCQDALATIMELVQRAPPDAREMFLGKARTVQRECLLQDLERAVAQAAAQLGRAPANLEEVVRLGLLPGIPQDPGGGRFFLGPQGAVENTVPVTRLRMRNPVQAAAASSTSRDQGAPASPAEGAPPDSGGQGPSGSIP